MADVREKAGELVTRAKRRVGVEAPSAAEDEGNVGIVRGAWRAFGEGDHDAFLDTLKPDVTWEVPSGDNFPGEESVRSRDEVREQFIENIGRTFTEFGFIPESYLDADDENTVVVFGRFRGEGAEGGAVDEPCAQVWVFQGTEAQHVRIYTDSSSFPEVVTEEKQQEWEEEERKKEEEEKEESEGEDESEAKGDEESEGEEDESSESKSDDESESKSEESSESKSEESSESKSDDDSESKGESDSDSSSESEKEKAESSS